MTKPAQAVPARVVVDTNVFISAALSPDGTPARLVALLLQHSRIVFCEASFNELHTRLWKPKFDRFLVMEMRNALLHDLRAVADWVPLPAGPLERHSRDADDDTFIHLALASGAAWLVSGDSDLLDMLPVPRVQVLTPAQALERLMDW